MSNSNEMNNTENILMIMAEPVIVAEEFNMNAVMAISVAELLTEDFTNDDEAEFVQGLLEIEMAIEDIILSDNPEEFLLPTQDDLAPALKLLEKIEELKNLRFGRRTISRMERRVVGENLIVQEPLTQLQKSTHPDYKDWCCPKCLNYYKGKKNLMFHMEREICSTNHTRLVVKAVTKKVVTPFFYHIASTLAPLFERAEQGRRQRQNELEEEMYALSDSDNEEEQVETAEEDIKVVTITAEEQAENDVTANVYEEEEQEDAELAEYEIRTWVYNTETKDIEYAGLFEVDGKDCWTIFEKPREKFDWAIQTGEMVCVELVVKQTDEIIDEWEDNIEQYLDPEEEDDSTPALEAYLQQEEAYKEGMKTTAEENNLFQICCLNCGLKKYVKKDIKNYYCEPICKGF